MKRFAVAQKGVMLSGASHGIGKHLAECFAVDGARLCLCALPDEAAALDTVAEDLRRNHRATVFTHGVDLSRPEGPDRFFEQAVADLGHVDVLVNNAGVLSYGTFTDIDWPAQDLMIRVNVVAYARLMHLVLPSMLNRGSGRIFNVVSASAFQPTPFHAVYGSTKAFVQNLSEAVADEIAGTGVTVFTLNPSYTATRMVADNLPPDLGWFSISGLSDPREIARSGYRAFVAGKSVYVPGLKNRLVHRHLIRFTPKAAAGWMARRALVSKSRG